MDEVILDLYCCAGGSGKGYAEAGFTVVGVDIVPQPHYPFEFVHGDVLAVLTDLLKGGVLAGYSLADFAGIHASPPCQEYTKSGKQWRKAGRIYPDLVSATRQLLIATGLPYVIENVPDSPLLNPIVLTGEVFGLNVARERLFECSFPVEQPILPPRRRAVKMGRPIKDGDIIQPVGHFSGVWYARKVMGLPWMNGYELSQAIPWKYTEYVGRFMMQEIKRRRNENS